MHRVKVRGGGPVGPRTGEDPPDRETKRAGIPHLFAEQHRCRLSRQKTGRESEPMGRNHLHLNSLKAQDTGRIKRMNTIPVNLDSTVRCRVQRALLKQYPARYQDTHSRPALKEYP